MNDHQMSASENLSEALKIFLPGHSEMTNGSTQALHLPVMPLPAGGLNPLIHAANPLLELAVLLGLQSIPPNAEELRYQICQMIKVFEQEGRASNIDIEKLGAARYCLCTFLDEVIASTAWGSEGWSSRSLLVTFHNEASGGERFFLILQRLAQQPSANKDVLELLYVILALNFEGRYRLLNDGRMQLDLIRRRLKEMLYSSQTIAGASHALSLHWQPVGHQVKRRLRLWPVWLTAVLAALGVAAFYLIFNFYLQQKVQSIVHTLRTQHLRVTPGTDEAGAPALSEPVRLEWPKLAALLNPEIEQGLLSVEQTENYALLTINGNGLFASGSAEIQPIYLSLLSHLGDILKGMPGRVVISGHTDDRPLRPGRFQSNWQLSQARAEAVRDLLISRFCAPARFTAHGRADSEPLAPNNTASNRARNRRVSIAIFAP